MPSRCLTIVDADQIHDYVFSPHRLKLIRGGSNLERQLNEIEMLRLLPKGSNVTWSDQDHPKINDRPGGTCEAIYAGGGTAVVEFADSLLAETYCHRVEEVFREQTSTATVSWAKQECTASFGETLDKAPEARSCHVRRIAPMRRGLRLVAAVRKVADSIFVRRIAPMRRGLPQGGE